jgi:hypothetical protein
VSTLPTCCYNKFNAQAKIGEFQANSVRYLNKLSTNPGVHVRQQMANHKRQNNSVQKNNKIAFLKQVIFFVCLIILSACSPQPSPAPTVSLTLTAATQEASDIASAQGAVQSYYAFLSEKEYEEAYDLLSTPKQNGQDLAEWTADQQYLINSITLLNIQHYPDFQATVVAASDGTGSQHPLDETRWCKVFVVTIDVDYVGGWGAEPSGEDSSFVVVIKEGGEWRLAEIASGIGRDICHTIH